MSDFDEYDDENYFDGGEDEGDYGDDCMVDEEETKQDCRMCKQKQRF